MSETKPRIYCDTSALLKRYIEEDRSDDFDEFFQEKSPLAISALTAVEFHFGLARRRRDKEISVQRERQALELFEDDVRNGYLVKLSLDDKSIEQAVLILALSDPIPLRSLDALHLSCARFNRYRSFATADQKQGSAALAIAMKLFWFGDPKDNPGN